MVIDRKSRDLLNKLHDVDSAVQKGRLEFAFQVDLIGWWHNGIDVVREQDQGDDVNRKLSEHRAQNVSVEDIRLRAFFREDFDRL